MTEAGLTLMSLQGVCVLFVEDEPRLRMLLTMALEREGCTVKTAQSAVSGALLLDDDVDLLITDIDLDDGPTGLDLAHLARQRRPQLPLIVASGHHLAVNALSSLAGSRYLPKPFTLDAVRSAMREILAETRAH